MKKIISLVVFMLMCINGISQTLHLVTAIDTSDKDSLVREIRRTEEIVTHKFFRSVSDCIGYNFDPKSFITWDSLTPTNLCTHLDTLDYNHGIIDNDIVVFYYFGHGKNEGDDWPSIHLKGDQMEHRFMRESDYFKAINRVSKKAKLVLCIASCCNNVVSTKGQPGTLGETFELDELAMRKLFCEFDGQLRIIVSSSKPGQPSYRIDPRNKKGRTECGSAYGIAFRDVFSNLKSQMSWDEILSRVSEEAAKKTSDKKEFIEGPQIAIAKIDTVLTFK